MEARTEATLEMHPDDATARGLATGDSVEVYNDRGRIHLQLRIGDAVPAGVVAARLDWAKLAREGAATGRNVNALTSETLTDIGGGATFYSTLVQVRAAAKAAVAAV
jgi:anaerobic selenocysteine-containing dehydrogenase